MKSKKDNLNEKTKDKKHFNKIPTDKFNKGLAGNKKDNLKIIPEVSNVASQNESVKEQADKEKKLLNEVIILKEEKLRLLAEMENLRKRFEREKIDLIKFSSINLIREILSPGDNLDRALASIPKNEMLPPSIKNLVEGLKMVQKEFSTILEKNGVKKIDSINKKFDHNYHQAMMEIETEVADEGIVVQEIQPGYIMYDRLLRPAMVGVSKKPSIKKMKNIKEKRDNKEKIKSEENQEK